MRRKRRGPIITPGDPLGESYDSFVLVRTRFTRRHPLSRSPERRRQSLVYSAARGRWFAFVTRSVLPEFASRKYIRLTSPDLLEGELPSAMTIYNEDRTGLPHELPSPPPGRLSFTDWALQRSAPEQQNQIRSLLEPSLSPPSPQ